MAGAGTGIAGRRVSEKSAHWLKLELPVLGTDIILESNSGLKGWVLLRTIPLSDDLTLNVGDGG